MDQQTPVSALAVSSQRTERCGSVWYAFILLYAQREREGEKEKEREREGERE